TIGANRPSDTQFGVPEAKAITIHRVSPRVATAEEIGSGEVGAQIAASIAANDLVVVGREQAIAQSVTDLTAAYQGTVATVQTHGSALAGLNGSVATLDLTTVAGTQYVAGIKATSWDSSGSGSGSLLQLLGDNVVAEGSLSTNRLAVGLGKNLIENSSFKAGLRGWARSGSGQANADATVAVRAPGQPWAGIASPTLAIHQSSSATTGETIIRHAPIRDVSGAAAQGIAVVPGEVIEASVNISAHRCACDIRIHYYNAAGVFFAGSGVLQSVSNNVGSENNPEQWDRIGGRHTVPVGAVLATIALYKLPTAPGEADSYAFWYHPQLCRSHAAATALTPYSPDGTTLVDGGSVITGSLMAEAANVGSFSAAGLAVFGGNLQSANWNGAGSGWRLTQAGELTVPNATIGTLKLPDGAISTLHQSRWGAYYNTGTEQWQRSITLQFGLDYDSNCYIRMWTQWAALDNGDNWLNIHFSPIGYR
ncbi:hypothetical protein, partial [Rhizorhabdus sp.]|uniref:hypothetical protein n=1 Tax=Rhizorhabdus sp. TaxID=1968843 RepID=UPI0019A47823